MKKTCVVFVLIVLILTLFCIGERFVLNRFKREMLAQIENVATQEEFFALEREYQLLSDLVERWELLLDHLIPREEIDRFNISIGHLEGYVSDKNLPEIKVSCAELLQIVEDISDPPKL